MSTVDLCETENNRSKTNVADTTAKLKTETSSTSSSLTLESNRPTSVLKHKPTEQDALKQNNETPRVKQVRIVDNVHVIMSREPAKAPQAQTEIPPQSQVVVTPTESQTQSESSKPTTTSTTKTTTMSTTEPNTATGPPIKTPSQQSPAEQQGSNIKVIDVKPAPAAQTQDDVNKVDSKPNNGNNTVKPTDTPNPKDSTPQTNSTTKGENPPEPDKSQPEKPDEKSKPENKPETTNSETKKEEKKAMPPVIPKPAFGGAAGRWGAAVEKTKTTKKRRSSNVEEVDPFLAKLGVVRARKKSMFKKDSGPSSKEDTTEDDEEEDDGCCDFECCSWVYWRDYVIDPADGSWFYWSMIAAFAVFYNMVVVFLRSVFTDFNRPDWQFTWFCFDYTTDFITIVDMCVRTRLGFLEQGILVVNKKRLFKVYIRSFRFVTDIISILPFDLCYLLVGVNTLLRLNRLARIWRIREFYNDSETRTTFPNMFRMVFLIINICLMIHWNACIYYSMSKAIGFGSDEWVFDPGRPGFDSLTMQYLFSFYWSMLTLTAIGDTAPPESSIAMLYCVIVTLCGVLIFATIFGNVGAMINQMNASRQEFQQNVDAVKRYMDIRRVSPVLQDRVIQWFAYTWNNKQSVDDKQALTILPEKLRAEIAIQVHLDTLKRVAIFKDCEPGLLQELVLKLRLQVFSPGDYICRKGDIGKEMYIIKRGKLEVVSPDGKIVFVTMQDGAVFGEVSILNIAGNKTGNRRTASVRSVGYSDLFCLSKDDLWDALKEYPDARQMLWEKGKQILRKDNLLDEDAARKKELADMSLETKIDRLGEMLEKMGLQIIGLEGGFGSVKKHLGIVIEEQSDTAVEKAK